MKKLLTIFFSFMLLIATSFAYTLNEKDYKILNKIYPKIQKLCIKSQQKCKILKNKIDKISVKYKNKERIYFLLTEISKYINKQVNKTILNSQKIIVFVTKVVDGDTIHFSLNGKDYVSRLIGIDAPENSTTRYGHTERLGNEAKDYLKKLILNKKVQIEYDKTQARTDKYGRHLIYIFYNGENINKKMIEVGLAKEFTYRNPYKYQKEFLQAQSLAKRLKRGIWGLKQEEQRKVIEEISDHDNKVSTCNIKGNINSKGEKIYHFPGCRDYNKTKITLSKGEKWFCTKQEAEQAGWRMAGNCR